MGEEKPTTAKKQDEKPKVKDLEVKDSKEQLRGGTAAQEQAQKNR
jgi:hypothetical protein